MVSCRRVRAHYAARNVLQSMGIQPKNTSIAGLILPEASEKCMLPNVHHKREHLRTTSGKWGQPGCGPRRGILSTIRGIVLVLSGCSEAHTVSSRPRRKALELQFSLLPAAALPRLRLLHGALQVGRLAAGAKFCMKEALPCHCIASAKRMIAVSSDCLSCSSECHTGDRPCREAENAEMLPMGRRKVRWAQARYTAAMRCRQRIAGKTTAYERRN